LNKLSPGPVFEKSDVLCAIEVQRAGRWIIILHYKGADRSEHVLMPGQDSDRAQLLRTLAYFAPTSSQFATERSGGFGPKEFAGAAPAASGVLCNNAPAANEANFLRLKWERGMTG
jgi:hypothetical protein